MCIYLVVDISYNIGSNGKCPLPVYCALPIASLDLIECILYIYCLNDLFKVYQAFPENGAPIYPSLNLPF